MSDSFTNITAYKGFDHNLQCRGFQFELQQTYTHEGKVKACESGFHACEYPLATFGYYAPAESRYADVSLSGQMHSDGGSDTKIAAASITINAELRIPELIKRAIAWITERCNPAKAAHATGDQSASSATGYQSASSATGYQSASSATGYRSASSATGDRSASSATGDRSASSATGDQSASSATGDQSAAINTGDAGSVEVFDGKRASFGVAVATGFAGRAKAAIGSAIVLVHRNDDGAILHIRAAIAGKEVKADTWYSLDATGEFYEVTP